MQFSQLAANIHIAGGVGGKRNGGVGNFIGKRRRSKQNSCGTTMENPDELPFKVGQLAEAKSFTKGFRGAWFRCKIHEIIVKNGFISHGLEYIDFPDEKKKVKMMKIYQVPIGRKIKGKEKERELMLRPRYPSRYDELNLPPVKDTTEVSVGVDDVWKVGDLVEWLSDGCFWTGKLTRASVDGKAQVMLLPSPEGEGGTYEVCYEDLRPALEWSPEYGWRPPSSKEAESCYYYARLSQQLNQGIDTAHKPAVGLLKYGISDKDEVSKDIDDKAGSPINASVSSNISDNSLPVSDKSNHRKTRNVSGLPYENISKTERPEDVDMRDSGTVKPSLSDSVSSSHIKCASAKTDVYTGAGDSYNSEKVLKKMKTDGSLPSNIMFSDSLHAVIMDLEELANKIQWLKGILDVGIPLSNDMTPSWKFVEHRGSSVPK